MGCSTQVIGRMDRNCSLGRVCTGEVNRLSETFLGTGKVLLDVGSMARSEEKHTTQNSNLSFTDVPHFLLDSQ